MILCSDKVPPRQPPTHRCVAVAYPRMIPIEGRQPQHSCVKMVAAGDRFNLVGLHLATKGDLRGSRNTLSTRKIVLVLINERVRKFIK